MSLTKSWMVMMTTMLLSLTVGLSYGESTSGREFIIMFLQMNVIEKDPTLIVATTENGSVIAVTIPKLNYTKSYNIASRTKMEISVPKSVVPTSDGVDNLGILVESTEIISIWAVHDASKRSADGFHVFPTSVLGKEYFGVSYKPHSGAELGVVAAENGTRVIVTYNQPYTIDGQTRLPRYPLKVTLDKFETLFMNVYTDITGIHIESSAPIAVFSGNQCAFIPSSSRSCDYIVTQLLPFTRWGMDFVVTPYLGHIIYFIKVVAGRPRTTITIGNGNKQYTIDKSESLTLNLKSREVISASRPVMVVQFTAAQSLDGGSSHAAMTVIPAIHQYTDSAIVVTLTDEQPILHFLNLVSTCYNLEKQYVLLDGSPIEVNNTEIIYLVDIAYCVSRMPLNTNYTIITSTVPDASFYAVINERSEFFSTARTVNFRLPQITCSTTNDYGVTVDHYCNSSVVIFTYPCPEPCPVYEEMELICGTCFDGYAIFIIMFMSSGLTLCAEHFIRCLRAGCQDEWEVEEWKRKAAMNQKSFDTSAWDRQLEITRKYERKKLEQELGEL